MINSNAEVVQTFELTENERIYGPIVLGYPKVNPNPYVVSALESIQSEKKEPLIKWI